jgi:hypothetical protein
MKISVLEKHFRFTIYTLLIISFVIVFISVTLVFHYNSLYLDIRDKQKLISFNQRWVYFNSQEILFFLNLRKELGFPPKSVRDISIKDMLQALSKLNKLKNYYENTTTKFEKYEGQKTFKKQAIINLAEETDSIFLPQLQRYRYQIINKGKKTVDGPILYQRYLWNTVRNLIKSAGFNSIDDELDKAKSIWRFVVENRYHFLPVTENDEEHDVIKYLSIYGYGFCDDTARVLSKLAEETGLKARTWVIGGGKHVVSEIYANGKWRMFDADRDICFYNKKTSEILSVSEISNIGDNVSKIDALSNKHKNILITQQVSLYAKGRKKVIKSGKARHEINYKLRPQEKIVFIDRNQGKYFLGKYPQNVPEYYNGFFDYKISYIDLKSSSGRIKVERLENGIKLINDSSKEGSVEISFNSPFPLVGGDISSAVQSKGDVELILSDPQNNIKHKHRFVGDLNLSTDAFFADLTSTPTYHYSIIIQLEAKSSVFLSSFRVKSYFQFAKIALLELHKGINIINIHWLETNNPKVEASIWGY